MNISNDSGIRVLEFEKMQIVILRTDRRGGLRQLAALARTTSRTRTATRVSGRRRGPRSWELGGDSSSLVLFQTTVCLLVGFGGSMDRWMD